MHNNCWHIKVCICFLRYGVYGMYVFVFLFFGFCFVYCHLLYVSITHADNGHKE